MAPSKELKYKEWSVLRHALVTQEDEEGQLVWKVEVWDNERDPFLERFFSTRAAAEHFLDKVRKDK